MAFSYQFLYISSIWLKPDIQRHTHKYIVIYNLVKYVQNRVTKIQELYMFTILWYHFYPWGSKFVCSHFCPGLWGRNFVSKKVWDNNNIYETNACIYTFLGVNSWIRFTHENWLPTYNNDSTVFPYWHRPRTYTPIPGVTSFTF